MTYHPQIDRQIERTNQELEQYLRMYIDHRQSNWLEQLVTAEFAFNNKVYTSIKSLLFKINYKRKSQMGFNIRKKKKHVKVGKFVKEMKDRHKEVKAVLVKLLQQLLVTKTNNYTSSKSLNMNIKWEVYKRTQQEVSAKLESYIYVLYTVCANNN